MALHDFLAHGEADAGAGVFFSCVQTLKDQENAFTVLGSNADAVVTYREAPFVSLVSYGTRS